MCYISLASTLWYHYGLGFLPSLYVPSFMFCSITINCHVFSPCILLYMNRRAHLLRCSLMVVLVLRCMEHIIQEVIDGPLISRGQCSPIYLKRSCRPTHSCVF